MNTEETKTKISELKDKIKELKNIKITWNKDKTEIGHCKVCSDWGDKKVMVFFDEKYCYKHLKERKQSIQGEIEETITTIEKEIVFYKKLLTITRFVHIADEAKEMRQILKQKENKWDYKFSDGDVRKGKKLLLLLERIKPKSSQFIDKGVCITQDLILAGEARSRYPHGDHAIYITAFDQDERYRSIARVGLTVTQAKRLNSLLREAIEHTQVMGMINDIIESMKLEE